MTDVNKDQTTETKSCETEIGKDYVWRIDIHQLKFDSDIRLG